MFAKQLINAVPEALRQFGAAPLGVQARKWLCLLPLWVDSVEKVLTAVGTKFLRAADAFNAARRGGPRRLEQKLSATFFFA